MSGRPRQINQVRYRPKKRSVEKGICKNERVVTESGSQVAAVQVPIPRGTEVSRSHGSRGERRQQPFLDVEHRIVEQLTVDLHHSHLVLRRAHCFWKSEIFISTATVCRKTRGLLLTLANFTSSAKLSF